MNTVVLVDHGVSWGIRDMAPVGFTDRGAAEKFADEARGFDDVENCFVLDLIDVPTYLRQHNLITAQ